VHTSGGRSYPQPEAVEATPQLSSRFGSGFQHARDKSGLEWRSVPRDESLLGETLGDRAQRLAAYRARNLDGARVELQSRFLSAVATSALASRRELGDKDARGTFMVSKFAVPFLEKWDNPHILMLSPPLDLKEKWFAGGTAYSTAKYGMSLVVLGLAGELRSKGVAVNALWPRTTIATSAIKNLRGGEPFTRRARASNRASDGSNASNASHTACSSTILAVILR
jgi:NAD(P)-dependent dehydrogenase (short-subunit alcohol dehydrogenase family)